MSDSIFIDIVHGATGNTESTWNIKDTCGVIELRRDGGTDNVSTKQGTAFVLDLIHRVEFAFGYTIGFVEVSRFVGKGNRNGAVLQQFLGDAASHLSGTENQDAFAFQEGLVPHTEAYSAGNKNTLLRIDKNFT